MSANDYQVGGQHYQRDGMQHWDLMGLLNADYFTGCATKYLYRLFDKDDPLENLAKAQHFVTKRSELYKRPPLLYVVTYRWHHKTVLDWLGSLHRQPNGTLQAWQRAALQSVLEFSPQATEDIACLGAALGEALEPNIRHTEPQ